MDETLLKKLKDAGALLALLLSLFLAYTNLEKRITILETEAVKKETLHAVISDIKEEIRNSVKEAVKELRAELEKNGR